jgi:SAM-dependent methyltransferase
MQARVARSAELSEAIEAVKEVFPFPSYLDADWTYAVARLARRLVQLAPPPARLLDIGSGPMDATGVFAQLGYRCCATDDLADAWHTLGDNRELIRNFAADLSIAFHLQDPSETRLPFDSESFDVVLLRHVIEHLHESPRDLLNTAFDLANTGGHIVIEMPNSVNLRKRLSVLRGRTNYPDVVGFFHSEGIWRGHVREYTLAEARFIVEAVGGEILIGDTVHMNMFRRLPSPFKRAAYRTMSSALPDLRDGILIVATKPHGWSPATASQAAYMEAISPLVAGGSLPDVRRPVARTNG